METFYQFEKCGMTDAWTELFQFGRTDSGMYEFRVWNPPVEEDDEPLWIEWESEEAASSSGVLEQLFAGIKDRGLRVEFALEAALALLPFLPEEDAKAVRASMAASLESDANLRDGIASLPDEARKALEPMLP